MKKAHTPFPKVSLFLMFVVVALLDYVTWKWVIPFLWNHGSSAAFDMAIFLGLISIVTTALPFQISYKDFRQAKSQRGKYS